MTINATIKDTIERIIFLNTMKISQTKEIYFNNESNKNDIINALKKSYSFSISEDEIYIEIDRTKEEIKKDTEHYESVKIYSISRLKKWFNQEKYKEEIEIYLNFKKLNNLLKEINTNL